MIRMVQMTSKHGRNFMNKQLFTSEFVGVNCIDPGQLELTLCDDEGRHYSLFIPSDDMARAITQTKAKSIWDALGEEQAKEFIQMLGKIWQFNSNPS